MVALNALITFLFYLQFRRFFFQRLHSEEKNKSDLLVSCQNMLWRSRLYYICLKTIFFKLAFLEIYPNTVLEVIIFLKWQRDRASKHHFRTQQNEFSTENQFRNYKSRTLSHDFLETYIPSNLAVTSNLPQTATRQLFIVKTESPRATLLEAKASQSHKRY